MHLTCEKSKKRLACDLSFTGIPMTTVVSDHCVPPVTAQYNGPTPYQRTSQPGPSDPLVKSVHFNTVHNCQQLGTSDRAPRATQLSDIDEDMTTTSLTAACIGQSLPASYRSRSSTGDLVQAQPSTPTATINRHYAVQPRTAYRPGLDSQAPATVCHNNTAGGPGCRSGIVGNGPRSVSPQCTVSDNGCVSPPTTRLRHYCV